MYIFEGTRNYRVRGMVATLCDPVLPHVSDLPILVLHPFHLSSYPSRLAADDYDQFKHGAFTGQGVLMSERLASEMENGR